MFRLIVTKEVKDEIEALSHSDVEAAASAVLLLDELALDQHALENLCVVGNRFKFRPPFEVKTFVAAARQGYNIFILKYLRDEEDSLPPYRLLVGFNAQKNVYYALALTHRDVSYSLSGDEYRALRHRYEQCGIPIYR